MVNPRNLQPDPREPQPGEAVAVESIFGEHGQICSIRTVVASDHSLGLHEVIDSRGETIYVSRSGPRRWTEVKVDL